MHFDNFGVFSDTGRHKRQVALILVVKMEALRSPILFPFSSATVSVKQGLKEALQQYLMNQRYGTYHIRVEMRRPTPTQSMNTTQRSSFIILKNPMSSTKPNPTVDTERKIYKSHQALCKVLGILDTAPAPPDAVGPVGERHENKPPRCVLWD